MSLHPLLPNGARVMWEVANAGLWIRESKNDQIAFLENLQISDDGDEV